MNGKPDAKNDFAILGRIQRDGLGWREKIEPNDTNPNPEEVAVSLVIEADHHRRGRWGPCPVRGRIVSRLFEQSNNNRTVAESAGLVAMPYSNLTWNQIA